MVSRIRQLIASNYGRDFGWYVEFKGAIIGELVDCQCDDMFWDSYAAVPFDEAIFNNWDHWNKCNFRFRNKTLDEYADKAFCGGAPPLVPNGRVGMHGLYLVPKGRIERLYASLFGRIYF